jgi:hypothetical protein
MMGTDEALRSDECMELQDSKREMYTKFQDL